MCLFKIHEDEEVRVPSRVVVRTTRTRSPSPVRRRSHHSVQRVSRDYVSQNRSSQSYVAVPAPRPLAIPAPQPVPVFVEPPPPPPPPPVAPSVHSHHGGYHHVEVSPRSSVSSHSPSRATESVVYEREYRRERNYSPESSPRYETFRYVEGAPPSESDRYERYVRRDRSRSRARSRSRDYGYEDPRGSYRETTTRIVIDEDGRRRREYRH
ncbi:hypothetical protein BDV96DRAFT_248864 [Lophiotrema nucula]|uniref:Uncharacterized protein n=1 Tax=Lophiotrema nucula TaxID=690887 RepID=A0A6A5YSA9_9PLEO|nr:hypothetical protein BDV96DRAFT_248864 [Lophiotrema nucula]